MIRFSTRFLFPMMALCLAMGIMLGSYVAVSLDAAICFMVVAGLFFVAFVLLRRGLGALLALTGLFVTLGFLRSLLPDVVLLPESLLDWSRSLSHSAISLLRQAELNDDTTALLEAMLMGQRTHLSDATLELYRQTGAAHILALSGLHLGILFGLFDYCLMHVLHVRWRFLVGTVGLALMWGYALLTGFPVSLCRASLMLSLLVIGQMRQVGNDTWHTLGLAAFLLLMVSPASLFDVGFQLSFSAVAGIFLFYRPSCEVWLPSSRGLRVFWRLWLLSMSAQVGTFPLLLCYFHRFALIGILLSPVYIFMATLIIYLALMLLLLVPLGMASLLSSSLERLVAVQHGLMELVTWIPYDRVEDVWLTWGQVVLLYGAILCLLPPLHVLRKPDVQLPHYRRAMFFRSWPYLLAALLLCVFALCL